MNEKLKLILVGHGMVGQRLLEELVTLDLNHQFEIIVFGDEPYPAYDRVALSSYFDGQSLSDLLIAEESFYEKHGITLKCNTRINHIDSKQKTVKTERGDYFSYDKLILATGSYPFVPPIKGNDRANCFVYRTIDDLEAIKSAAKNARSGVVIGGGLLGLEAANALRHLKLETHVIEFAPSLMANQLDFEGGNVLKDHIEKLGIQVMTDTATKEIKAGESQTHKLMFTDDSSLETDLIVFSAGIRPNDQLARDAQLNLGERGGVVIDNMCLTSDPNIFAIGEVALWENKIFGLVAPGYQMARIVAQFLRSVVDKSYKPQSYFTGADMSTKLKLLGIDVGSIGNVHLKSDSIKSYSYKNEAKGIYKRILVHVKTRKLVAAILVGDAFEYTGLHQLLLNETKLPENPESLILPQHNTESSSVFGITELPPSATVCSCNNVTKEHLCQAIQQGVTDLLELKSQTRAATSCGGCAPLVKQVLDCELEKSGVEIDRSICEHFSFSRQELYHLVRVEKCTSFHDVLHKHGKGEGCDICKPAIASILASCWNDFILSEQHAGLQDTNDYYLANLQRDGSYSVVPRIPGGEITPDKLIVIGEVAKKFDLYTKITGGQRIDLFGARVDQLPDIWKDLIDAGFESGHAYGKALRTVKSCVGSTWCRFGVQDSVTEAINIEQRYRGLRAPHKIKMAVSGCTRECAEAQSKDVGVIATEKGWNLYVAGNGGMKPRHADLFASDLSTEELIKIIDRFLMFYIQTADRLQRTSTWLNSLEGGLQYLKEVILEDSLGIAKELEQQMAENIQRYECEWKKAVENPEMRKRFTHFVNSEETDPTLKFDEMRGQKTPVDWNKQ